MTEGNVLSSLNLSYFGLSELFSCHILVGEKKMGMLLNAIQLGSTSLATKRLYLSMYKMKVRLESALGEQLG